MPLPIDSLPANDPADPTRPMTQIDLWLFAYGDLDDPALWDRYHRWLTPAEQARHDRFVFAAGRRQFLAARALVRRALSAYGPVDPADWRFTPDAHGRPLISGPAGAPTLHFSLSHTEGLIVCAVSRGLAALGVDVEAVDRRLSPLDLAGRFFAPAEARALRAAPASETRDRFFSLWTLKESYVKARGLGLALGLERFAFDLDAGDLDRAAPMIHFTAPPDDHADRWRFASLDSGSGYRLAVSAATEGAPLALAASRIIP